MKFKNKGRKIYKTKEKNYYGKTPFGKFMSGALTVLLLGGIGFLGYSAAEPLVNYTKKKGDSDIIVSSTEAATVAATEEKATAAEINVSENTNLEVYRGVSLSYEDMRSIDSLSAALQNINNTEMYQYVSVPLKTDGGALYYSSSVTEAQMSGAVQSSLTLSEITAAIRAAGFKPAAEISLLKDHIIPVTYADMSYTTAGDGSRWIDGSGNYWVSPFSERTVEYLGEISDEIAAADFDKAICCDVVFPPFKASDLELFSEEIKGSDRYLALTSLTNLIYSRLLSGGTTMMLEVSAIDILQENCEVVEPMLLDVNTLVLDIDFDELGSSVSAPGTVYEFTGSAADRTSKLIGLVQYKLDGYNTVIRFSGTGVSETDLAQARQTAADYGYSSFIIG